MQPEASCPRCAGPVRPPDLWSSAWRCERHGEVLPNYLLPRACADALTHLLDVASVPVWLPWPLPHGWLVTGLGYAGDERTGARATLVACSGPAPLGGGADLLLIAEDPGIGLGARYAGLPGPDPGDGVGTGQPYAVVKAVGHDTPLWNVPAATECAAFVGEAKGLWLWALLWPAAADVLLLEDLRLCDLRDGEPGAALEFGAAPPLLHR